MLDFDRDEKLRLDSHEWIDTGRQFSRFFPSHAMKAYKTLLQLETVSFSKRESSILEKSRFIMIDIGCGGGAASVALLSLILNYQKYKAALGIPLFPIDIQFIGVDPNVNALRLYGKMLESCIPNIVNSLVYVSGIMVLPGKLSDNSVELAESIEMRTRTHCAIFAFANVIRPLANELENNNAIRRGFEAIGLGKLLPANWGRGIGFREINLIQSLFSSNKIDHIVTFLVAAKGKSIDGSRRNWQEDADLFFNALLSKFGLNHSLVGNIQQYNFRMINPTSCYLRKRLKHERSIPIEYYSGFAVISSENFISDQQWEKMLSIENLLLAWARVRNAYEYEMIEDTIELRLFEVNIKERLAKLRDEILSYEWSALHLLDVKPYDLPKGVGKNPRPMCLCRIEEQILAAAMLQVREEEYNSRSPRLYSYWLTNRKSEYLYEHWFDAHEEYHDDASNVARKNPDHLVIQTDLASYYPTIRRNELSEMLRDELKLSGSRSEDLTQMIISRGQNDDQNGLPQGHIASGAFSNIYLSIIDDLFAPGNKFGVEYFRFVDDMVFIVPPSLRPEDLLAVLDESLSSPKIRRAIIIAPSLAL